MSSRSKFRVAICGAGIGGLVAAVALSKYPDIEAEVYEAAVELAEVGAGITVFSRPWEILRRLGLADDLLKHTEVRQGPAPYIRYRKGNENLGADVHKLVMHGNMFTFHRADFQQCLLRSLPTSCRTHCSKRLKSYSQQPTGSVELVFEDESTAVCDLLIGADGLKSAVRKTFIKEKVAWAGSRGRVNEAAEYDAAVDPVWTGTVAYRALISPERLRSCAPDHPIFSAPIQNYYLGKDSYVIAYPISRGKFINFAAFTTQPDLEDTIFDGPWFSPVEKEAFTGLFTSWETEVQQLISNIDKPLRWAIHTVKPLKSFVSGSVVLIGDAAHAMTPYLGSGAGQALEDAYILASLLGHRATTPQTLHHALHVYDEIRRPKALKVAEKSRRLGQCFMLHDYDFQGISQEAVSGELKLVGEEIARLSEWTWNTPIDGLVEEALNMLLRNTAL